MKTLSLVIPAYNEEARLPELLDALARGAEPAVEQAGMSLHESLVVDDGSTDRTREMLRAAAAEHPRLRAVFDYETNRGKGAAFAAGVAHAGGDYVLLADADLSTPIDELHKLTGAIRAGADLAIGSRAVSGAIVERGPVHRKLMGAGFNRTVRALTGLRLHDTQCGFKLIPTTVARQLLADQSCEGFAFDVELLMKADRAGLRIAEVPVLYLHDSRSRVRVVSASLRMLRDVGGLAYRLRMRGNGDGADPERAPLAGVSADDPD